MNRNRGLISLHSLSSENTVNSENSGSDMKATSLKELINTCNEYTTFIFLQIVDMFVNFSKNSRYT